MTQGVGHRPNRTHQVRKQHRLLGGARCLASHWCCWLEHDLYLQGHGRSLGRSWGGRHSDGRLAGSGTFEVSRAGSRASTRNVPGTSW